MGIIKQTNHDELEQIADEVRKCNKCWLHEERTNAVPGEGSLDADIMLIGEGPGKQEDREGRPFVGRAGELLEELFAAAGLSREEVFITSVVKCRPPNNRTPKKDEVHACNPYLQRQIKVIQPKVIGTLGNHATETLLGKFGIRRLHGQKYEFKEYILIPLYHPAAGLYYPTLRAEMIKDMKRLVKERKFSKTEM